MIRTRALRKIFITTLSMFILLTVFSLPSFQDENVLRTNFEVENIVGVTTDNIYLINKNGYLVKNKVFIGDCGIEEKMMHIIKLLYDNNNSQFPSGLSGIIPNSTKINNINIDEGIVTIDFSKEILKVSASLEKQMITAIVYSIMEIDNINGIIILVDGKRLDKYPNCLEKLDLILDKSIGINNKYLLNSRNNVSKVVIYYLEDIDSSLYYVPVTKYLNDDREKIKIIIEELSSNYIYEPNLMSFLNDKIELIDYREEGDVLFLNFNDYLYDSSDKILEEVVYSIAYSVFDNYDVNMVLFEVNDEKVKYVSRNDY